MLSFQAKKKRKKSVGGRGGNLHGPPPANPLGTMFRDVLCPVFYLAGKLHVYNEGWEGGGSGAHHDSETEL